MMCKSSNNIIMLLEIIRNADTNYLGKKRTLNCFTWLFDVYSFTYILILLLLKYDRRYRECKNLFDLYSTSS